MKWCCPIFEGLASFAGEGGISIVVITIDGQDSFMLQARAVDAGVDVGYTKFKLYTGVQQAIFHCPGCGSKLREYYKDSLDLLRRDDLDLWPQLNKGDASPS